MLMLGLVCIGKLLLVEFEAMVMEILPPVTFATGMMMKATPASQST